MKASGVRSIYNQPVGKRSPILRSLVLILCRSQVQVTFLPSGIQLNRPLTPHFILFFLQLLDTWLNSQKDNERERAMWCTARILGFTAKMNNFGVSGSLPWSPGPHPYPYRKLHHILPSLNYSSSSSISLVPSSTFSCASHSLSFLPQSFSLPTN